VREVIQVQLVDPPIYFASMVNGILVLETMIFQDYPSHRDLYNIQVLRGMDGVPGHGFPKLVGVVVDRSRKHLKSYLLEFPQTKWDTIFDLVTESSAISWEQRENLAKQVVERVRQLHSKSFVIGTLWRFRPYPS
jgi:hypothetical protein